MEVVDGVLSYEKYICVTVDALDVLLAIIVGFDCY